MFALCSQVADLKMIFKALDPDMPEDEVEQIISEVDEDGSGTVDYEGSSSRNARRSPSTTLVLSLHRILQTDEWLAEPRHKRSALFRFSFLFCHH